MSEGVFAKWGGRRFIMTVFMLAACAALLCFDNLDSGDFKDLVMFLFGFYATANTVQKATETLADVHVQKETIKQEKTHEN